MQVGCSGTRHGAPAARNGASNTRSYTMSGYSCHWHPSRVLPSPPLEPPPAYACLSSRTGPLLPKPCIQPGANLAFSRCANRFSIPDGEMRVDVRLDRETVWLTQRQMAEVFDTTPENVLMHLRNVFASEELAADATTKKFLVVRTEGKRQAKRQIKHYNLDAIISVGYRSRPILRANVKQNARNRILFLTNHPQKT